MAMNWNRWICLVWFALIPLPGNAGPSVIGAPGTIAGATVSTATATVTANQANFVENSGDLLFLSATLRAGNGAGTAQRHSGRRHDMSSGKVFLPLDLSQEFCNST